MKFLSYKQDATPTFGDTDVVDRVHLIADEPLATVDTAFAAFMDTLIALPDHTPSIQRVSMLEIQNNTASVLIHYRLVGPSPMPVP